MKNKILKSLLSFSLFFASYQVPTTINASSEGELILHYTFDDASNENKDGLCYDVSGHNNNGVMTGTSIINEGLSGGALALRGFTDNDANRVDSYVTLPTTILDGLSEITVSTWVYYLYDSTNYWSRVFDIGKGTNGYFFVCKGGRASYGAGGYNYADIDAPTYADGVWTNIAITYSKNHFCYYIDGILYDESEATLPALSVLTPASCAYIGKSQYAADTCLTANIDEFRIYDKALSVKEIRNIMVENMDDKMCVERDADLLDLGNTKGIRKDLTLPETGSYGTTITYESEDETTITDDGKLIPFENGAKGTNLIATIRKNETYVTKTFYVSTLGINDPSYTINASGDGYVFDISETFSAGFFEDTITLDGGLNAQMIKNTSFEFEDNKEGWQASENTSFEILSTNPLNDKNLHYARISNSGKIYNTGFYNNMSTKANYTYKLSFYARSDANQTVTVYLVNSNKITLSKEINFDLTSEFSKYEAEFTVKGAYENIALCFEATSNGNLDLDMVSLLPETNFKGIENIFNEDLVSLIANMNIKALRFPGGCVIEGLSDENGNLLYYNSWKDGVGPIEERQIIRNKWGGYQSNEIGYYEYFLLCEALGIDAIPVVNAGMSCQIGGGAYSSNDTTYYCPLDQMRETFVQDALDLVEFANGDETTYWGKIRIAMGHEEPFNLKYVAIGNEQYGSEYLSRLAIFKEAFTQEQPDITLVTSSGPSCEGSYFEEAWDEINENYQDDIVDEHYYVSNEWLLNNTHRYDSYYRDSAGVYIGEFAARNADYKSTLYAALCEAAYMTGLTKNSDIVKMYSYAPMFQCADQSIWSPALIWYTGNQIYESASYYNQVIFGNNTGDKLISSTMTDHTAQSVTGTFFLGAYQTEIDYDEVKVTDNKTSEVIYANDFTSPTWSWLGPNAEDDADFGFYNAYDATVSPVPHWFIGGDGYVKTVDVTRLGDKAQIATMNDTRFVYKKGYNMSNYTLEVKARKYSGYEGFLIGFGCENMNTYYQFNWGGYGNSRILLEHNVDGVKSIVAEATATVPVCETDVLYNIKIVVNGSHIECYVDGTLYITYDVPNTDVYEVVTLDSETNELIYKIVNTTELDQLIEVNIDNCEVIATKEIILKGTSKDAENSFAHPNNVYIEENEIDNLGNNFKYVASAYTLTVLRLKVKYVDISSTNGNSFKEGEKTTLTLNNLSSMNITSITIEDETIASINENTITGLTYGTTNVIINLENGIKEIYPITIEYDESKHQETSDSSSASEDSSLSESESYSESESNSLSETSSEVTSELTSEITSETKKDSSISSETSKESASTSEQKEETKKGCKGGVIPSITLSAISLLAILFKKKRRV